MKKLLIQGLSVASLGLGGCAFAADKPTVSQDVDTRVLVSSKPADYDDASPVPFEHAFLWGGLDKYDDVKEDKAFTDNDKRLRAECFAPSKTVDTGAGAIASFFIGPVVGLVTDAIKSELEKALKEYSASFSGSDQSPFYSEVDGAVSQAWRCVRVTRTLTVTTTEASGKKTSKRTVDFDLLLQVAMIGPDDKVVLKGQALRDAYGLKVRPLRTYLARPIARGSTVALAGSVTFDGLWREGAVSKQQTLFTADAFKKKFKRASTGWTDAPYYFPDKDLQGNDVPNAFPAWERQAYLPIVPLSTVGAGATQVTVTFKGAEVGEGDGKAALKVISKLFGAVQSDLNDVLSKAAKSLVEEPAPTPAPEKYCGTFTGTPSAGGTFQWSKDPKACEPAPTT